MAPVSSIEFVKSNTGTKLPNYGANCHQLAPDCRFSGFHSAQDIQKNDEIFISYSPSLDLNHNISAEDVIV